MRSPIRKFTVHVVILWDPEPDSPSDEGPSDTIFVGHGTVEGEGAHAAISGTPSLMCTIARLVRGVVTGLGQVKPSATVCGEAVLVPLPELGLFGEASLN